MVRDQAVGAWDSTRAPTMRYNVRRATWRVAYAARVIMIAGLRAPRKTFEENSSTKDTDDDPSPARRSTKPLSARRSARAGLLRLQLPRPRLRACSS